MFYVERRKAFNQTDTTVHYALPRYLSVVSVFGGPDVGI